MSTKGVNPLKFGCFDSHQSANQASRASDGSGFKETLLPPIDPASLTGGRRLREWTEKYERSMLQAKIMFDMDLYNEAAIPAVGSLVKVYAW